MEQPQRSSFWSSLPGVLTGTAALITAATGGYLAFDRTADKAGATGASPAQGTVEPQPASATPEPAGTPIAPKPAAAGGGEAADPSSSDGGGQPAVDPAPDPGVATRQARPSFDCARASTAVERLVCSDADLADRDRQVAAQYFALRGSLPANVRSQLLQSQRQFLRLRSDCPTSACLANLYDVRLRQLAEFAAN